MDERDRLGRRRLLQALAGGAGAGFALPAFVAGEEGHRHVREQARLEEAAGRAVAAGEAPGFLDAHQRETLASLAEAIVPGSEKAGTAAFLDRLLAVDSADGQRAFLAALGAIEGEAIGRYGRSWKGLEPSQRHELLTALATGPSSRTSRYGLDTAPAAPTPRDRFDELKARIAVAYFTSEPGLRELGYTGEPIHQAFEGCTHPAGH